MSDFVPAMVRSGQGWQIHRWELPLFVREWRISGRPDLVMVREVEEEAEEAGEEREHANVVEKTSTITKAMGERRKGPAARKKTKACKRKRQFLIIDFKRSNKFQVPTPSDLRKRMQDKQLVRLQKTYFFKCCLQVHTYKHTHIHTYIYVQTFTHPYSHPYIHTSIHLSTHTHTQLNLYRSLLLHPENLAIVRPPTRAGSDVDVGTATTCAAGDVDRREDIDVEVFMMVVCVHDELETYKEFQMPLIAPHIMRRIIHSCRQISKRATSK